MIEFRKATVDDIDTLVALRKDQLIDEGEIPDADITKNLERFFQNGLSDGTFMSIVAVSDGQIVATSGLSLYIVPPHYGNYTGKIAQVGNMYTRPEFRRQKLGTMLLEMLLEYAQEEGYTFIRVKASKQGRLLYASFGFDETKNLMELIL